MNESVMMDIILTLLHEGVASGNRDLTVAHDAVIAYPNPVTERVRIHMERLRAGAEAQVYDAQVYDAQGKLLKAERLTREMHDIDLSGMRPGLLQVRVRNEKKVTTLSLIKL
jgi:hypothetical protein